MNRPAQDIDVVNPSRPKRIPKSADEPKTLIDVFKAIPLRHPRNDTINYKRDGQWIPISAAELLDHAQNIAAGLYSIGVRPGDRVALLSESRAEWTLMDAGCLFAGAVDVPIYPTLTPSQVQYILADSGASVLVLADRQKFDELREILPSCHAVKHVIFFDQHDVPNEALTLEELEARGRQLRSEQPTRIDELGQATTPADLATIIYTSGTTGEPKGVMLTHSNLVTNLVDSSGHLDFGEGDIALSVLPLSHVFERQAMYMYLYRGIQVYFAESLLTIGPNLREVRPTILVGVPRIFEKIYGRIRDHAAEKGRLSVIILAWSVSVAREYSRYVLSRKPAPFWLQLKHRIASRLVFSRWRDAFGGRIRILISGGAALSADLAGIYIGAGLPIVQGYGLTETAPVMTTSNISNIKVGTVGTPIPNVEIRIAEDGEIETRGPNVMSGYYNKPAETRAVFTEDGWFKTGDIGTIDENGFLRITDRKKELFKTSGGKYIAPQPIEEAIKRSRFVNQVVLIGNERKFPAALIVPDWELIDSYVRLKGLPEQTRAERCRNERIINLFERQIDSLTSDLAKYERVKRIALLENEFTIEGGELTPTLKVKRRVIDEKYREIIEQLYADVAG